MRTLKLLLLLLFLSIHVYPQKIYEVNMEATTKWAQGIDGVTSNKVFWGNPSSNNYTERLWVQEAIEKDTVGIC